jgi:hypothetical protein
MFVVELLDCRMGKRVLARRAFWYLQRKLLEERQSAAAFQAWAMKLCISPRYACGA